MPALKKPITFETTFARFVATEQVGQGGNGVVYKATNDRGEPVALKVLSPVKAASRELRARFKNELQFGTRNQHKNVITVLDHGLLGQGEQSTPFYVMPFFEKSLRTLIADGISHDQVLPFFSQCLDGVQAAHLQGVHHRDLKPENILYNPTNKQLVIADFGIAQFAQDELYTLVETKPNTRIGNFQYAAPEQRERSGRCDQRTDIFALGLILCEMFTQKVPYGTGRPTVAALAPQFIYLDELIDNMIRQNASERPSSIEVIKRELIGRQSAFVQRQELDRLKQTVIQTTELDDPIKADPIRIIDRDWNRGTLTLTLNQPTNGHWIDAFKSPYSRTSVPNRGPEAFRFQGNAASLQVDSHDAQRAIDYFKSWLPIVHSIYVTRRQREKEQAERAHREQIERETLAREERLRTVSRLTI